MMLSVIEPQDNGSKSLVGNANLLLLCFSEGLFLEHLFEVKLRALRKASNTLRHFVLIVSLMRF